MHPDASVIAMPMTTMIEFFIMMLKLFSMQTQLSACCGSQSCAPRQPCQASVLALPILHWQLSVRKNTVNLMKLVSMLLSCLLLTLTGCSTTPVAQNPPVKPATPPKPAKDTPETVIVTYRVQSGQEAAFPALLARAWGIYRTEHLVASQPHIIVKELEANGNTRFVEIFTWVNHAAPEQAPASVRSIWSQEMLACEPRDGHQGLEGGEVELIKP